jgi:hypothetical protein
MCNDSYPDVINTSEWFGSNQDFWPASGFDIEDGPEEVELVEEGLWTDEGKYFKRELIIKHADYPGAFYKLYVTLSGSYFTDYHYNTCDKMIRVKKVEKIIHVWQSVGGSE